MLALKITSIEDCGCFVQQSLTLGVAEQNYLVWIGSLTKFGCSVFSWDHAVSCFAVLVTRSGTFSIYHLVRLHSSCQS